MNLPPDKLKLLSQYDNEKKWELVCDQVRIHTEVAESRKASVFPWQQVMSGKLPRALSVRVTAVEELMCL